ncbi:MAG: DUF3108 domain-containing protein [Woeseiaceae bacterium]|nr:DUF3108 domain-containing protein [Woeseiaceae bacterium]
MVFACLLVPLTALAGSALTPHVAEYKVRISVLGGSLKTRFEATEHGYYAESVISATGMSRLIARGTINEKSWFAVRDGNVLPIQYRSADTISSDHDIVDLDFNWREQEITGFINGEDFHAPLDGEVHDRVSLQYGLMYDLLNGGEKQKYLLQDADELKPLTIANVGMKTVEVPYGEFSALGIQHQREGSSRVTTLWCAEELGWLPVIIEQHRNGKLRLRAILADYQPIEGPLSSSAE